MTRLASIIAALLLLGAVSAPQVSAQAACSVQAAVSRTHQSVARVSTDNGSGTAFYIGDNEWVTAAHVVGFASSVTLRNAHGTRSGTVVGVRKDLDLAVIQASAIGSALEWGSEPAVGSTVIVLGYGRGQQSASAGAKRGIVSETFMGSGAPIWDGGATWRTDATYVRTDAAANRGDSGAPLLDTCGRVVGVFLALHVETGVEGVRYALAGASAETHLQSVRDAGLPPDAAAELDADIDLIFDWWVWTWDTIDTLYDAPSASKRAAVAVELREAEQELYHIRNDLWARDYADTGYACNQARRWAANFASAVEIYAALHALHSEWHGDPNAGTYASDEIEDVSSYLFVAYRQASYHHAQCGSP